MPEDLTVMVVDPGARGHVISERYEISPHVKRIIAASANDFVGFNRRKEVIVDGNGCHTNPDAILALAMKYKPDLIDVAQDDALALGAVDLLRENKFTVFGPTQAAAQIEWDKAWSRKFQKRYGIPHPDFRIYTDRVLAKKYIEQLFDDVPRRRVWVKAAGLAAGKGAISARTIAEAYSAIDAMDGFKEAGETFLLESDIDPNGEEYSIYALSDGVNYYIFKSAQDYKRAHDGDKGPNTGGMGAISPAMVTRGIEGDIEEQMIRRAIEGMSVEGRPFKGVLYLGGMKKSDGSSSVVEYNARFGDPETQVVLPGLKTDYVDAVSAVIEGRLDGLKIEEDGKTRVCIVGASKGYPGDYSRVKGKRIYGLEEAMAVPGVTVYGAGIRMEDGNFYANGGRLFSVVGEGDNIIHAQERARDVMERISVEGDNLYWRNDIGLRDIGRYRKAISIS